jgi:hypothetical protein
VSWPIKISACAGEHARLSEQRAELIDAASCATAAASDWSDVPLSRE